MPESAGEKPIIDRKPNEPPNPFKRPDKFPPGKVNMASDPIQAALDANRADTDADFAARKQRTADEITGKHRRMEEEEQGSRDFLNDTRKFKKK